MHVRNCAPVRPGRDVASDDEVLLERMKLHDDGGAYRLLVERHVDNAYALALRLLGETAAAEDVIHDAMIMAWTHRHDWEPGGTRFSTWLYRIVVDRYAGRQRRPAGADATLRSHGSRRLEAALGELPEQQRTALTLSYVNHLTNAEVADVMGTTVSAVENLLKRARRHLREVLRDNEAGMRADLGQPDSNNTGEPNPAGSRFRPPGITC